MSWTVSRRLAVAATLVATLVLAGCNPAEETASSGQSGSDRDQGRPHQLLAEVTDARAIVRNGNDGAASGQFYFPEPDATVQGTLRFNFEVTADEPIQQLYIAPEGVQDESLWWSLCSESCQALGSEGVGATHIEAW